MARRAAFASLFFLSGACALVYELCWQRLAALHAGSDHAATAVVVGVFMAGLGLGAAWGGRRAERWRRPERAYGLIECAIAGYAAATPLLLGGPYLWLDALLMLPPAVLMGATLPVLARAWEARGADAAGGAGWLYGLNTVGACAGAALGGLALLPTVGLQATMWGTAAVNAAVGAAALAMSGPSAEPVAEPPARAPRAWLVAVAMAGFASLACEIAWTRVLTLVLGGSLQAFAVVLATFLAALGLGAAGFSALLRRDPSRARTVFALLALSAAGMTAFSTAVFPALPEVFRRAYWELDLAGRPERILEVQLVVAALLMAVPTLLMAGLLPTAMIAVVHAHGRAARRVGALVAWNTAGAVGGSLAAGFVLVPLLGMRGAVLAATAVLCAAAAVASWRWMLPGAVLFAVAAAATPAWNEILMSKSMAHYAGHYQKLDEGGLEANLLWAEEIVYYRDGINATVAVTRSRRRGDEQRFLLTDGKYDGSSRSDLPTQRLSAHVPLLLHPSPREIGVIGLGTGCTAGSAALYGRVEVAEIEPAVAEAARWFEKENHGLAGVEIRFVDGRRWLRERRGAFDVVISEPSSPWRAGSADLFTLEAFRLGAGALREGGIFCQWVNLYGMSPENLRTIVRTFLEVFPHAYIVSPLLHADILLVGAREPFEVDVARIAERMARPEVADDLAHAAIRIRTVEAFVAHLRLAPPQTRALAGAGPLNTDDLPRVAFSAPRDVYKQTRDANEDLLSGHAAGVADFVKRGSDFSVDRYAEAYDRYRRPAEKERAVGAIKRRVATD